MALCSHGGPRQAFPRPTSQLGLSFSLSLVIWVDIDAPIVQTTSSRSGPEPTPEQISTLADMGFSRPQARKALRQTVCGLIAVSFVLSLTNSLTNSLFRLMEIRKTCRTEIQSVPSNGSSRTRMIQARKTKVETQETPQAQRLRRSPDLPRCLRATALGRSSRTRAHPSIRATTSRTFARRKMVVIPGYSSTTKRSSGQTQRASVRSSP